MTVHIPGPVAGFAMLMLWVALMVSALIDVWISDAQAKFTTTAFILIASYQLGRWTYDVWHKEAS